MRAVIVLHHYLDLPLPAVAATSGFPSAPRNRAPPSPRAVARGVGRRCAVWPRPRGRTSVMTTRDTFGRDLGSAARGGANRVPDHLAEVLVQSAATRARGGRASKGGSPDGYRRSRTASQPATIAIMLLVVGALALRPWPRCGSPASVQPRTSASPRTAGSSSSTGRRSRATRQAGGPAGRSGSPRPAQSPVDLTRWPIRRASWDSLARLDMKSRAARRRPSRSARSSASAVPCLVARRDDRPVQHVRWTAGTCRDGEVGQDRGARDRHQHAECRQPYRTVASGLVADGGSGRLRCRDAGRGGRRHRICGPPDGGDLHAVGPDRVETLFGRDRWTPRLTVSSSRPTTPLGALVQILDLPSGT